MSLVLPAVSVTVGPLWATEINAALTAVDAHDHSTGQGRQVRSRGINVDADLPFGGNNATQLRSTRYLDQGSPLTGVDVACVYSVAGELFYNDALGNAVQITSGGALNAASLGAIGGDYGTSTASEYYTSSSQKFSFVSAPGVPAYMGCGPVTICEPSAGIVNGVRLKSPTSLATAYDLVFPAALPASTRFLTVDASGVIADTYNVDNSTLEVSSGSVRVKDQGITAAKVLSHTLTGLQMTADLAITVAAPVGGSSPATKTYADAGVASAVASSLASMVSHVLGGLAYVALVQGDGTVLRLIGSTTGVTVTRITTGVYQINDARLTTSSVGLATLNAGVTAGEISFTRAGGSMQIITHNLSGSAADYGFAVMVIV